MLAKCFYHSSINISHHIANITKFLIETQLKLATAASQICNQSYPATIKAFSSRTARAMQWNPAIAPVPRAQSTANVDGQRWYTRLPLLQAVLKSITSAVVRQNLKWDGTTTSLRLNTRLTAIRLDYRSISGNSRTIMKISTLNGKSNVNQSRIATDQRDAIYV